MISVWYNPREDKFSINLHRHFLRKVGYINGQKHLLVEIYYIKNKIPTSYYIYEKKYLKDDMAKVKKQRVSLGYAIYQVLRFKYGTPEVTRDKRADYLKYRNMH